MAYSILGRAQGDLREIRAQDIYEPTARLIGLASENKLLQFGRKTAQAQTRYGPNVVQWARQDLKQKRFLTTSSHAHWRLSEDGKETYESVKKLFDESGLPFEKFVERFVEDNT